MDAISEFGGAVMAEISGEKANKMDKILEQKKPRFLKLKSTNKEKRTQTRNK